MNEERESHQEESSLQDTLETETYIFRSDEMWVYKHDLDLMLRH